MEERYIYVPQGRAAIMTQSTLNQGIDGLYSNEFSSCVLAIFRNTSNNSLLYFHVDFLCVMDSTSSLAIKKLLESFKEKNQKMKIELIYREGQEKHTLQGLSNILGELYYGDPTITGQKGVPVRDEHTYLGALAKLDQETAFASPQHLIQHFGHPPKYEYHPEHKKIQFIRRIEEVVTQRALKAKTPYTNKTICIFDGTKWISPLPLEYDLRIDCTKKEVNEDMQLLETLREHKDALIIAKVRGVLDTLQKKEVKFADIERSANILHPALINYFAAVPIMPDAQPSVPTSLVGDAKKQAEDKQKIASKSPTQITSLDIEQLSNGIEKYLATNTFFEKNNLEGALSLVKRSLKDLEHLAPTNENYISANLLAGRILCKMGTICKGKKEFEQAIKHLSEGKDYLAKGKRGLEQAESRCKSDKLPLLKMLQQCNEDIVSCQDELRGSRSERTKEIVHEI